MYGQYEYLYGVLILVLMEDTLGGVRGMKALFQAGGE